MDTWSADTEHTSSSVRFSRVLSAVGTAGVSAVLAFFVFLRPPSGNNFFIGKPESKRILIRTSMSTPLLKVTFSFFNVILKCCTQTDIVDGVALS